MMIYANRREAGEILAKKLSEKNLDLKNSIVCAIPRGGAVVANVISQKLNIPLTVLVVKKLGAPFNSELAIGATASFGKPVLDRWLIKDLDVSADFLKKEIATKKKEARSRENFLNVEIVPEKFKGKTIIVADDGTATGQTAKMAAKTLRQLAASKIILAVACAPPGVARELKKEYDEVVCGEVSANFIAVGQFYRDFRSVEDNEVKQILSASAQAVDN